MPTWHITEAHCSGELRCALDLDSCLEAFRNCEMVVRSRGARPAKRAATEWWAQGIEARDGVGPQAELAPSSAELRIHFWQPPAAAWRNTWGRAVVVVDATGEMRVHLSTLGDRVQSSEAITGVALG